MKDQIKKYSEMIIAVAIVAILYIFMEAVLGITCPIKYITGISCPCCGMSRAWMALLHMNMRGAMYYHPLFWIPPIAAMVVLLKNKISLPVFNALMITMGMLFIIVYLYRMVAGTGDVCVFNPENNIIFRIIGLDAID